MRPSWRRLVIMVFYVFCLWILFHMFLLYWKQRRGPPIDVSFSGPKSILKQYSTVRVQSLYFPKPLVWRDSARFKDKIWKIWTDEMKESKTVLSAGHFIGFQGQFAHLSPVLIDGSMVQGRLGGEEIMSVLNQPEHKEFLEFRTGFFQIPCDEPPSYSFQLGNRNHLNTYMKSLSCTKAFHTATSQLAGNKTVFIVTRYEYVNIYHSMTDFYNAFLNMAFLGLNPDNVIVLLADAHPKGGLDEVWSTLFHNYSRVGELRDQRHLVEDMVWVQLSYLSPLINHKINAIPAIEEFRQFFLDRYRILNINRPLNCSELRVTFIWRRDYLAHPRNPSGHVVRKIKNEAELVAEVRHEIPNARVFGTQIDLLSMRQQLQMAADCDILIGMHGAGLTHTLFLPKHAGLVELYPTYWSEGNVHFKKIAHWRHLHYKRWVNHNPRLELANHYTKIPPGVVSSMVRQILHSMHCTDHEH